MLRNVSHRWDQGVAPDGIEYLQDLQDYHVAIRGGAITDEQIDGVINTLEPISVVQFANTETSQRFVVARMRGHPGRGQGIIGGI